MRITVGAPSILKTRLTPDRLPVYFVIMSIKNILSMPIDIPINFFGDTPPVSMPIERMPVTGNTMAESWRAVGRYLAAAEGKLKAEYEQKKEIQNSSQSGKNRHK